jgi:thiol:disulfide interchange protein DsbG
VKKFVRRMVWCVLASGLLAACSSPHEAAPKASASGGAHAGTAVVDSPAAQVDWTQMQAFWTRSMQRTGIDTGPADSDKRMLVYFDPNCPVCARQWRVLEPYLDRVRIHWVPVAYINPMSTKRAAAILAASNPVDALETNERRYDFKRDEGGLPVPRNVPAWAIEKVEANTRESMHAKDLVATPILGFELYPGKRYYRIMGLMDADAIQRAVDELGHTMDPWHPAATGSRSTAARRP